MVGGNPPPDFACSASFFISSCDGMPPPKPIMMPGVAKMKSQIANAGLDESILKRQMAIIDSMTPQERRNPDVLKASRGAFSAVC